MELSWIIPLAGGVAAAIGLFLSKPERPRWALATLILLLVTSGWQAAAEYSAARTTRALQLRAHRELVISTNRLLGLHARMHGESTDGWLPASEDEFFSSRLVESICLNLDLDAPALVTPSQSWGKHSAWVASGVRRTYREVLATSGPYLDSELVDAVSRIDASFLMLLLTMRTEYPSQPFPANLCLGVEEQVNEAVPHLRRVYHLLNKRESLNGLSVTDPWLDFANPTYDSIMGRSRFSNTRAGAG